MQASLARSATASDSPSGGTLAARIEAAVEALPESVQVAVAAFRPAERDSILLDAHDSMHAASTMKVGVLIELFRGVDLGRWRLADSLEIENRFRSIMDGSPYALDIADDSDSLPYARIGRRESLAWLAERMIAVSSNLSTNLLVDLVTPDSVGVTLEGLGAGELHVRRGVEDGLAFRAGLNNTTTAYGLAKAFEAIAQAQAGDPVSGISRSGAEAMAAILSRQVFDEGLPAALPRGVRVAHKTGWIEGIDHDGGIVYPPARHPYVLVVLTRGFADSAAARRTIAGVSRIVWEAWGSAGSGRRP